MKCFICFCLFTWVFFGSSCTNELDVTNGGSMQHQEVLTKSIY